MIIITHIYTYTYTGLYTCNEVISSTTEFVLPDFPSKYNGPINCAYYVFLPSRRNTIKLTFLYLDIQNADCETDRIEIYDTLSSFTPIQMICKGNKSVEFTSNQQVIVMKYVGNSGYRGFHASVTFS